MSALITRNYAHGGEPEVRIDGRLVMDEHVRAFLLNVLASNDRREGRQSD